MTQPPFPIFLDIADVPSQGVQRLIDDGIYYVNFSDKEEPCYLYYEGNMLAIKLNDISQQLTLSIDFTSGRSQHRRLYGGGKSQPLPKACGLDKHPGWTIFDATAGLGKDAFVLASLGAEVTLCEEHPALYGMLNDAIARALLSINTATIAQQMHSVHSNSIDYLARVNKEERLKPDVIYLDPMYPERKKSAKIKKDMQILQYLVGHSGKEHALLEKGLMTARHRVVVKRPKSARPIGTVKPNYTVSSVNTRYDVYLAR